MTEQAIKSSDQLIQTAIKIASEGRRKRVAVAAAQDGAVLEAMVSAQQDRFIDGVLVGDQGKIEKLADSAQIDISPFEIINEIDVVKAAHTAAALASQKKADVIMKGFLPTSALLKSLLDKQYLLRGNNSLSHCAILTIPGFERMLNVTDGGVIVDPDRQQKSEILENALLVSRALGLSPIRVAISGIADGEGESSNKTARLISDLKQKHDDILIDGPMLLDQAAMMAGGAKSSLDKQADIYLVGSIEEGNLVAKALIQLARAVFAGVIVGAKVPVSMVSRTDSIENKKASIAVACLLADYYERMAIWDGGAK